MLGNQWGPTYECLESNISDEPKMGKPDLEECHNWNGEEGLPSPVFVCNPLEGSLYVEAILCHLLVKYVSYASDISGKMEL